jgi:hypothetical protein
MHDSIIEADIYCLNEAASETSTAEERRRLERLADGKVPASQPSRASGPWFRHAHPVEDLNYLFYRQQVERSRAAGASCPIARDAHERLGEFFENRIYDLTCGRIMISPRLP